MRRIKNSRSLRRRGFGLFMTLAVAVTSLPFHVLAAEAGEVPEVTSAVGRPSVHDYGKSGDDPTTAEDESAIVYNDDVRKSAQYQESTKYELKANGTPVSVYKYQKQSAPGKYYHMDVARFSSDDAEPVFEVTLKDGSTIDSVVAYPERYYPQDAFTISEDKKTVTFQMSEGLRYCILNINGTQNDVNGKPQLAIINDPTEVKPNLSGNNVLNFKEFSEQYLEEHPITDTVGEKCRDAGSVTDTSLNNGTEYTWEYGEGVYEEYQSKGVTFPNKRTRLSYDVSDAFQAALEKVRNSENLDTIYFPAGTYVWSGLSIKDWDGNGADGALTIYTDEDALMVNRLQECQEAMEPAIGIWNSSNITISGRGIYDGQGTYICTTDSIDADKSGHQGGCMLVHSQNITFNDTYVRDAKQWNWECHTVQNITYNNIKGLTPFQHSWVDGLDLTSGKNITVNGAITMGNDDTFAAGHFNPSDGFPNSALKGKNLSALTDTEKNIAAAAGIYNNDRLQWDQDDSENCTVNNTLGWSTFANAVRLGHNTRWKENGGSYQMKSYTFNNMNTVHVTGWSPNGGGGALSIQNGTSGCTPNYESLVFNNCSFADNGENNLRFPNTTNLTNFHPEEVTVRDCWFNDADSPLEFRNIKNVTIENLHLGGKLIEYTSQLSKLTVENVDNFTFTANGMPLKDNELPVITAPAESLQAYAGNPLIFYLQAEDADGDEVTIHEADVSAMDGAVFDSTTGKFSWTPSEDEIGKSYKVTFAVSDYTEQQVKRTVKIEVGSPTNSAMSFPVAEDAHVQSWKGEKESNYGTTRYLSTVLIPNSGLMSEDFTNTNTGDGTDGKIIYLKFNLDKIREKEGLYNKAELMLTYIIRRRNANEDATNSIRVAAVEDADWSADTITWNTKPTFAETLTEENTSVSEEFHMGTAGQDKPSGDNQAINGAKVKVDITDFVTDAIKAGKDALTLAVCETSGTEVYFVSSEGAAAFKNATADMAPSILLNLPVAIDLEGPSGMTITEGYETTESSSFALKGTGPFEVTLSCENGDGKITWNEETQQIQIEKGLADGTYQVTLKVKNAAGDEKTAEFTVTVLDNPEITDTPSVDKTKLQDLYNEKKDLTQGNYTDNTWASFTQALKAAEEVLKNENATEEEVATAMNNLQNASEGLVAIEVNKASLKKAVTMVQEIINGDQAFTEESWNNLLNSYNVATEVLNNENASQQEVDDAWRNLILAYADLENGVQKTGLQMAINNAETLLADPDTTADYTGESIQAVQEALTKAKEVLNTEYEDVEAGQAAVNEATTSLITAVTQMLQKDYGRLQDLIDQAENILEKSDKFTPDSTGILQNAVDEAKHVIEQKLDTADINQAYEKLMEAMTGIQLRANKAELEAVLAKAKEILDNADKYLDTTLEGLQDAYNSAAKVDADDNAVQEVVDRVLETLTKECMEARILGDVDLNGTVDSADSALLLKYNAELTELTEEQCLVGDVNRDGVSDTADASAILELVSEKITAF